MWAFVDHCPDGTGEPLSVRLRPGNAGSNTAADHITVREALRQLAAAVRPAAVVYLAAPAGDAVCCRCDRPIAGGTPAASVPGLDGRGLAHPDC